MNRPADAARLLFVWRPKLVPKRRAITYFTPSAAEQNVARPLGARLLKSAGVAPIGLVFRDDRPRLSDQARLSALPEVRGQLGDLRPGQFPLSEEHFGDARFTDGRGSRCFPLARPPAVRLRAWEIDETSYKTKELDRVVHPASDRPGMRTGQPSASGWEASDHKEVSHEQEVRCTSFV